MSAPAPPAWAALLVRAGWLASVVLGWPARVVLLPPVGLARGRAAQGWLAGWCAAVARACVQSPRAETPALARVPAPPGFRPRSPAACAGSHSCAVADLRCNQ